MAVPSPSEDEIAGRTLYGDNFSSEHIREWYESEVSGYFDLLAHDQKFTNADSEYDYEYDALNQFHAIGGLLNQRFNTCLALGCAAGNDIAPLAAVVEQFIAIEPAEKWWHSHIGGKAATYMKPSAMGDMQIESGTIDLVTSFGVLHHIPNVSHVVGKIARVLKPGGLFVLREPISSMGDWRKARTGLTANERGLPIRWFESLAAASGFKIVTRRACMFGPLSTLIRKLGISLPFAKMPIVKLDWLISEAFRWNARYWRDTLAKKFAPSSAFWILERRPEKMN